jgi:hypothetical protein
MLSPALVGRLGHLKGPADLGNGLALGDQLLGGRELAKDLLRSVADTFRAGSRPALPE